ERLLRHSHGGIDIGGVRHRNVTNHFARRRIRYLSGASALGPNQFASDKQRYGFSLHKRFVYDILHVPCPNTAILNLLARFSLSRARMLVSAPTATNWQPISSQCFASASTNVRIPGALPAFRMRRMASSINGFTLELAVSPA